MLEPYSQGRDGYDQELYSALCGVDGWEGDTTERVSNCLILPHRPYTFLLSQLGEAGGFDTYRSGLEGGEVDVQQEMDALHYAHFSVGLLACLPTS